VAALAASLILTGSMLGRPLGSIIFGSLSDRIGRKPVTAITVSGFGLCTIFMGLLPGYATWGVVSLYLLIALRFIAGIFLGGEYTAANVLAMEGATKEKRGLYSGIIQSGYPVAFLLIAILTFTMLHFFPLQGGVDSPYMTIGWRIPFFIGGGFALLFILPFRATISESKLWIRAEKRRNPFKLVMGGANLRHFMQVFVVVTGLWFTGIGAAGGVLPGVLIRVVHLNPQVMTQVMMVCSTVLIGGYIWAGALSQTFGRRNVLVACGVLAGTVGVYCYYLLLTYKGGSFATIALLATIVVVTATSGWGVVTAYLNERFPTVVRSSGFGMAFTIPVIIPSFYGVYMDQLSKVMPAHLTPTVLVAFGAVLTVVGALFGPETKDVDLNSSAGI